MVEAIFWDNDGVLVDTEHLYFEATRRVLAQAGIELTEDDYRELFLVQGRGAWHLAEARGLSAPAVEALKEQRNALYAELIADAPRVCPECPRSSRPFTGIPDGRRDQLAASSLRDHPSRYRPAVVFRFRHHG